MTIANTRTTTAHIFYDRICDDTFNEEFFLPLLEENGQVKAGPYMLRWSVFKDGSIIFTMDNGEEMKMITLKDKDELAFLLRQSEKSYGHEQIQ